MNVRMRFALSLAVGLGVFASVGAIVRADDPSAAPSASVAPSAAAVPAATPNSEPTTAADGCLEYASGNLILDPGAEDAVPVGADGKKVPVPKWNASGQFTAVAYSGSGNFQSLADPHAPMPGKNYFAGGPGVVLSTGSQLVKLSTKQLGKSPYSLCGWFGGYEGQNDSATLTATFLDATGKRLSSVTIGGVKAADRSGKSGMLLRSKAGFVPAHATLVKLVLTMKRTDGNYDDGYADNLDLSIGTPAAT